MKSRLSKALNRNAIVRKFHRFSFVKIVEAKILQRYLEPRGRKICDVACGVGIHSVGLARKGYQVWGIDMNRESIEIAKSVARTDDCSFLVGDAENLPFKSEVFDKVVCVCSLEHFNNDENALREMNRILKDGGSLILTVESFTYRGVKDDHFREIAQKEYHVLNFYSLTSLAAKLEATGFQLKKGEYFINSPISSLFFNLRLRLHHGLELKLKLGYVFDAMFPIVCSLSILSDRILGDNNRGYQLAVKARKVLLNSGETTKL